MTKFKVGDILRLKEAGVPKHYTVTNIYNDVKVRTIRSDGRSMTVNLMSRLIYNDKGNLADEDERINWKSDTFHVEPKYFVYSKTMKLNAIMEVLDEKN